MADEWEHIRRPPTAAQIAARQKATKSAVERSAFTRTHIEGVNDVERAARLVPRLIDRRVVLSDGKPAQLRHYKDLLVARFGAGEFWIVNRELKPQRHATTTEVVRAGFGGPYKVRDEERQAVIDLEVKLATRKPKKTEAK